MSSRSCASVGGGRLRSWSWISSCKILTADAPASRTTTSCCSICASCSSPKIRRSSAILESMIAEAPSNSCRRAAVCGARPNALHQSRVLPGHKGFNLVSQLSEFTCSGRSRRQVV
eukprot:7971837-Pyramimonas_sp.AAC.1